MRPQTERLWGESSDGCEIERMSSAERHAADLLISKYKLMATHTLNTRACGETHRSAGGREVADLPKPRRRMCWPGRNKRICHFLFVSKTRVAVYHFNATLLCVHVCARARTSVLLH